MRLSLLHTIDAHAMKKFPREMVIDVLSSEIKTFTYSTMIYCIAMLQHQSNLNR